MLKLRMGADVGGTFTDVVLIDGRGQMHFGKTTTTYPDPSAGILAGLDLALQRADSSLSSVDTIIHGTTLVANALIERKGAKTALITTHGFRDLLEIGSEHRYDLYDLFLDKPAPLVPRELCVAVTERVLVDGSVLQPLDEEQVRKIVGQLYREGVEAIAVCLLHSYKNATHEQRIRSIIQAVAPSIRVSLSSEVVPEIREYERACTTAANAFVQPVVERYLTNLEAQLRAKGFKGNLLVMLSGGGTCTVETASRFPVRILESGPVGGTMAASFHGARAQIANLLAFDMGGTTAKASVVDFGKPLTSHLFEVARAHRFKRGSGIPIKVPVIEMIEIGAGGGSIARIDRMGLLKVGPESAGSQPGPVCYARGGTEPTVTDADLVLGYLDPEFFLGGSMQLDVAAARQAIAEKVAGPLGLSLIEAAWGIHRVVCENMAGAARIHCIERGKDVRSYAMFAFGGAGPVHACTVASILGVKKLVIPVAAGVYSALGFLTSPISFEFVRTYHGQLDAMNWDAVNALTAEMEAEGVALLERAGVSRSDIQVTRSCDMRYLGQSHEISVPMPAGALNAERSHELATNFADRYREVYMEVSKGLQIDLLNWRVHVTGPTPDLALATAEPGNVHPEPKTHRPIYIPTEKRFRQVPVYNRSALMPGASVQGPAIVEEEESTLVLALGFRLLVDPYLNLVVTEDDGGQN